jgi:hypothetical protein
MSKYVIRYSVYVGSSRYLRIFIRPEFTPNTIEHATRFDSRNDAIAFFVDLNIAHAVVSYIPVSR